jgi:hypothetical protein
MKDYGVVKLHNLKCPTETWIHVYLDKENKIAHFLDIGEPGKATLKDAMDHLFHIEVGNVLREDLYGYKVWLYGIDGYITVYSNGLFPRINENEKLMPNEFLIEMRNRRG